MAKKKAEPDTKTIRFANENDRKLLHTLIAESEREGRTFSQHVKFILRKHLERKSK